MAINLTAGLDPGYERFLEARPDNPDMRDAAIMWVFDDSGTFALPRFSIDAVGGHWNEPVVTLNMVTADGRALRIWERFAAQAGNGGNRLGAGPLRFTCDEPYKSWHFDFDGEARQSSVEDERAGHLGGANVPLAFHVEAAMAEPPWLMGGLTAEAARAMQANGASLMGGLRYEQLCRVSGWLRLSGEERRISGTGMRVRRRGVRNMGGAPGHCQMTALFSSGRAFGANVFWPDAAGHSPFNEAFVMLPGGRRLAARVAEAPWMHRLVPAGDAAPLVLESAEGKISIAAHTVLKMFDHHLFEMADTSVLEQGMARYRWDGEETLGLIERCTLRERLEGTAHG